ncbi:MAG: Zn-dependent exopeptidase M28, partial [Phycisphaerales bacterium]
MEGRQMLRRVVVFLIAGLAVAPALPALASPEGEVAAGLVSEENYRHYLDDMLYTHDGDDRGFGPEHDLAQANIVSVLTSFDLTVELEPFPYDSDYDGTDETYYNVVGTMLGTTYPDQEYLIGAHYDSWFNPGADDNASGVALVLEAARVLSAHDSDYTIRFVAFDREEQMMIGSQAYVVDHAEDNILGMINADMVAYNHGDDLARIFGRPSSDPHKIALAKAVALYSDGLSYFLGGERTADHVPFEWVGFQACHLREDFGNPYYHTAEDSVDTPGYIDYAYATQMTRSVVGFLVDNAGVNGVNLDTPDADYDGDGDVDLDDFDAFSTCYSGSGNPPATGCEFFDFHGDNDVDCVDWAVFEASWTQPGYPPPFRECPPALILPIAVAEGGRYVLVTPRGHSWPMALLVTGDPDDPAVSCVSRYVRADGRLGTIPVYRTFDEWGTVLVHGEEIIPGASYCVQCDYGEPGSP